MLGDHQSVNTALRVAEIFVDRHLLIGLENQLLTLIVGLALVRCITAVAGRQMLPTMRSSLVRAVLLISLWKGALYTVFGESFYKGRPWHFSWGVQMPDIREVLYLKAQSDMSIWGHAPLTSEVTICLVGFAVLCLCLRVAKVVSDDYCVSQAAADVPASLAADLHDALATAAAAIRKPYLSSVRLKVTDSLHGGRLYVLGAVQPSIVIDIDTARELHSRGCLEIALRHELMHVSRADNIARWFQQYLQDVAFLTGASRMISTKAMDIEENLCDAGCVKNPSDAYNLSLAISIAAENEANIGRSALSPGFMGLALGRHQTVKERLEFVLEYTRACNIPAGGAKTPIYYLLGVMRLAIVAVLVLLLLITCYLKFRLFYMTPVS